MVSSTTPRFGPMCPPVLETALTKKSRISAARTGNCEGASDRRSSGLWIFSSNSMRMRLFREDFPSYGDHHLLKGLPGTDERVGADLALSRQ